MALALALASCSRTPKTCAVCQRDECTGLAFRVTLPDGKTIETCCPRCGLHYLRSTGPTARSIQASDFVSGQWIDATKATYVSASDVSHCASKETRRDAYGCCAMKDFDRCLPSLIAFESRNAAQSFQKEHSGELLAFRDLSVK